MDHGHSDAAEPGDEAEEGIRGEQRSRKEEDHPENHSGKEDRDHGVADASGLPSAYEPRDQRPQQRHPEERQRQEKHPGGRSADTASSFCIGKFRQAIRSSDEDTQNPAAGSIRNPAMLVCFLPSA